MSLVQNSSRIYVGHAPLIPSFGSVRATDCDGVEGESLGPTRSTTVYCVVEYFNFHQPSGTRLKNKRFTGESRDGEGCLDGLSIEPGEVTVLS